MFIVPIDYPTRDKLDKEWHSDYVVRSYPFFMWVTMKYNAKMIWQIENHPFGLQFKTQEEANNFINKFNITCDIITVGTNVEGSTKSPMTSTGVLTHSESQRIEDGFMNSRAISFISKMKKMLSGLN